MRSVSWRFNDRRPLRLANFGAGVLEACEQARPQTVIATGAAPLTATALQALRGLGIVCVNYSTDDPWNPTQTANWFLQALPYYDLILTTRRANISDFQHIGCTDVRYLPFGYDDELFGSSGGSMRGDAREVLFVGGADKERVAFVYEFIGAGPPITLVGEYWRTAKQLRPFALGQRTPNEVRELTSKAKINLCLVRRANRDGHVMRSFEIAALGGCMLAENTVEHQEIFGPDREAVVYFRTPREAAERACSLLADPVERARLSVAVRARILSGAHTYRDRLVSILETASQTRRSHGESSRSAVSDATA
jgi:spore maturation protein CgeB